MPTGPSYWRSLDELANTPDFRTWIEREFPAGASELTGVNRRHFLKIMAASFGLAGLGLAGCRQPREYIMPYGKQPERIVPGVPIFYATSMPAGAEHIPLIVETHDARPTKIEGNPSFSAYGGGTDGMTQASVLDLYDPDRAHNSSDRDNNALTKAQLADLLSQVRREFKANRGRGLAFLAQPSSSPTRRTIQEDIKKAFPEAIWAEYQPAAEVTTELALLQATGKRLRPSYNLLKAKRVLALESNFLSEGPAHLQYVRDFTSHRKIKRSRDAVKMNRLYAIESNFTTTGGMADHRLRISASQIPAVTYLIAAEVYRQTQGSAALTALFEQRGQGVTVDAKWLNECVRDLVQHAKESVVIAGPDLPDDVQLTIAAINSQLQAVGNTLEYLQVDQPKAEATIADLATAINQKQVNTLIILGGNPAYDAPADLNWAEIQPQVPRVICHSYYRDETTTLANYHIAASHYLETWSDGRTWDGTYVPVQPMILPLFDTLSELQLLSLFISDNAPEPYDLVKATFQRLAGMTTEALAFDKWLVQGVLTGSRYPAQPSALAESQLGTAITGITPPAVPPLSLSHLEFRFVNSPQIGDGRYNNNGWLQECPDPMSKLCWDNAVQVSPRLAKELQKTTAVQIIPSPSFLSEEGQMAPNANHFRQGKQHAPVVELTVDGRSIKGPLHIQPGLADYTIVLTRGYGRRKSGRVGQGTGFDVYPLIAASNHGYLTGGTLRVTEEIYRLANTQEHWSMEGRAIVREANNTDYASHPKFAKTMGMEAHSPSIYGPDKNMPYQEKVAKIPRGESLYETPAFTGLQQWGMTIDLNACTGCNACVIACQSENNVPIVGKDQVMRGREMQWIRLDRYYSSGDAGSDEIPEDPQVSFMGMMCQHCELAPCESVCPVNATVHDESGLNVMAYNRCVGTRYCANNCPYKVRRFNFFDWNKREIGHFYEGPLGPSGMPAMHKMQKNPNVTVRMRGVMEKCTYCVQRIEAAKINQLAKAKNSSKVKVPDGTIKTACQQVCPAEAITFGDVKDPSTQVSQWQNVDRSYAVLGYLNVRPRTSYLARLRNPNPLMPDYHSMPLSRIEYEKRFGQGETPAHNGKQEPHGKPTQV